MSQVAPCPVPDLAILAPFEKTEGAYTDCFAVVIERRVSLEDLILAFFSTRLFKLEAFILKITGMGDTSGAALALYAKGQSDAYAAWTTLERSENVIVMRAGSDMIRSWLVVEKVGERQTRLIFGSAVLPVSGRSGPPKIPNSVRALIGFHKLYSRMLLSAAARSLRI